MPDSSATNRFAGYAIREECWTILGRSFRLAWPADMDGLLDDPVTLRRFERDEYMPYWAQPWPVAVLLAEVVLRGVEGSGRPAVDIGCGIGLVGLAAAMMGWRVTMADYDADAVQFAVHNAAGNGYQVSAACMDFRKPLALPQFDLILAADLVYERRNCEPLARWISSALNKGGVALVTDPDRSAAEAFPRHAADLGMNVETQWLETVGPAGLVIKGRLWRLSR